MNTVVILTAITAVVSLAVAAAVITVVTTAAITVRAAVITAVTAAEEGCCQPDLHLARHYFETVTERFFVRSLVEN